MGLILHSDSGLRIALRLSVVLLSASVHPYLLIIESTGISLLSIFVSDGWPAVGILKSTDVINLSTFFSYLADDKDAVLYFIVSVFGSQSPS